MFATDGTWRIAERSPRARREPVEIALAASVVLLLTVAALLAMRRLCGALAAPLPVLPLVLTAIGLLAWAAAVRARLPDARVGLLVAAVALLFAIGCSFPFERTIDWLVWLPAVLGLGLIPARRSSPASFRFSSDKATGLVLQRLTRSRSADGVEAIRGELVAEFAPGDRIAILHVAFCPPFERLPTIEAKRSEGPSCDVKIGQILHQGVRLEVRLSRASTAERRATIEFAASSASAFTA
ncbi:MAG: hypothetical protein AB7G28_18570 [Pirellulales bacterium]